MKHPLTPEEYNQLLNILDEAGLLNPLVRSCDWDHLTAEEQQGLYEAVEYIVGPYERDLLAKDVDDEG